MLRVFPGIGLCEPLFCVKALDLLHILLNFQQDFQRPIQIVLVSHLFLARRPDDRPL